MGVYDHSAASLEGQPVKFTDYRGKVLLIVNTASQCGFTPQYTGLEALHQRYEGEGLAVLGFPCNQFGDQEPGDAEEIRRFCSLNYGVSFPMFAKIEVNGPGAHPLYVDLKESRRGLMGSTSIKWNFTKFLVDREGEVVARYGPATKPEKLRTAIERLL
jgi:glutathione peroxidase